MSNKTIIHHKRPSLFWLATEAHRAIAEMSVFHPYRKLSEYFTTSGDGHPVLVLPGFLSTDKSTARLRYFIDTIGYTSLEWNLGRNEAREEDIDLLTERLVEIHRTYGQKVSLVGWSLGGIYARQIAKARPELVRQIITLGSPFRGVGMPNNVTWIYNLINGGKTIRDVDPILMADLPIPAPVPTTAIYSRQDGIVPWRFCMEKEETIFHQNVEVRSSHLGMGMNPSVLKLIGDRLLLSAINWRHFTGDNSVERLFWYPNLRSKSA